MKERKEFHRNVLDREIRVTVEHLDYGNCITIFGGEKTHIGAAVVADEAGILHSIGLPGHRELEICEEWARDLYAVTREPVSVTAGVHYDEISRENLKSVIQVLKEMKEEVKKTI
ncbi:MAG: hypothetical protein LUE29_13565 [Lachnospiraceae bacterium]|nr:hypothetical protein [Lachnospiraceae bacterium]